MAIILSDFEDLLLVSMVSSFAVMNSKNQVKRLLRGRFDHKKDFLPSSFSCFEVLSLTE